MPVLISTNQYMPFYIVAFNIVPPNACLENYRNKNSIISYLRLSSLSPLSLDTQSYTKFLQLKSTNKNTGNAIQKFQKAISHSLCKALGIPLCCTFRKSRLLYIAKITTSINQKNSSEGIWQGELTEEGGVRDDSSPGRIQPALLLQTKLSTRKCY